MRKLIVSVLAALGLLAAQAAPAGAIVLQPGQEILVTYATCQVRAQYNTFGNAFAYMTETAGSVCSYPTRIRVKSILPNNTIGFGPWCDLTGRLTEPNDPYGDHCVYNGLTTMSVLPGYGVGFEMRLCPNPSQCALFKYNILGP